ncbi:MAG: tetratricopeptide repeat protein [Acidimicrobiia bacterium]
MTVIDVFESDFAAAVLEESRRRPVVVDFWAEWCGPCKVLGPTLERLAAEGAGSWLLAKVDVDRNQGLARQFGVQGIPTVVAFRDGAAVTRFTGALSESQVRAFLGSVVPNELDLRVTAAEEALSRGDVTAAEDEFRAVLAQDPAHVAAGVGLASVLLDRDESAAALEVLNRLPRSEEVRRLEAAARLWADGGDLAALRETAGSGSDHDRLRYAKALAVDGDTAEAMQLLVDLVAERGELAEEARAALVDLFELLGQNHPLVGEYRRKLASALF